MFTNMKHMGFDSCVRFNDRHDMACVYILDNVEGIFIITEHQLVKPDCCITLVNHKTNNEWKIYSAGEKLDDYM